MTDDATLSDFASDDSAAGDSAVDDSSVDGGDGTDSPDGRGPASADDATDDPATADEPRGTPGDSGVSTYAWGEYACSRCDRAVDRVWRADGSLVCPDCKEW
ncbi:DUF7573 domain-containing protein [Natrinema salaciae]|uniref:DUF7573 domain-containing protein n=1 Tax=Natrinema salaciae TaxID=1186196 RepID=A0A1H9MZV5_9EURY|nr:hypothetical protein [Natrinema salaciae]SER29111.1 hypothetical protein SAMN04489841_3566 [Natrinema salaciae]